MSRYRLLNREETYVGWDNPLGTFFLQVFNPDKKSDDELVLNVGCHYDECPTVESLVAIAGTADIYIPDWLCARLQQDKNCSDEPTPLQKHFRKTFGY